MRMEKNALGCLLAWSIVTLVVVSGPARLVAQAKPLVNVDPNGVGIHGYDPVAYLTEGKAVKGDPQYKSSFGGATYYFNSSANKAAFDKEPNEYAPQYGGYCAMAMTMGKLEDIDPNQFLVHDRKLFLQRNEKARIMFAKDPARNQQESRRKLGKVAGATR